MRLIGVVNAKPGDILGQTILSNNGSIMLKENVILTERYINKLHKIGIRYVYIHEEMLEDIEPQDPKFLEIKSDVVKQLSNVFSKLEYNIENVSLQGTLSAVTDIVEYLLENKNISQTYLMEIKTYDNYTYVHSLNTCVLALFFGVQLSYNKSKLIELGMGSLLHDVGKTKIAKSILNKNDKLSTEEFEIMKKHSQYGYDIVNKMNDMSYRSKLIVLQHHERIDGNGYPKGIKGDRISKFAQITSISDVYDAMVSDRIYRKKIKENEAYELILGGAGTLFDWELVNIFKNNFSIYPLGVCVKLSDGQEGFIVGHNKCFPDRPIVRVLYNQEGAKIEPMEIDMVESLDICIDHIII